MTNDYQMIAVALRHYIDWQGGSLDPIDLAVYEDIHGRYERMGENLELALRRIGRGRDDEEVPSV